MLLASAGLTLTGMINAEAQTAPPAKDFAGQHKPRPLPFDPTRLKGISEKLIKSHWENNYSGAVNALNAVEQRLVTMLGDKDPPPYVYGDLKREELVRAQALLSCTNTTSLTWAATVNRAVMFLTQLDKRSATMINGKLNSNAQATRSAAVQAG